MKTLNKSVPNLLSFNSEELTTMSFIQTGKHAVLLTMLLTGISPTLAFGQSLMTPAKSIAFEPKELSAATTAKKKSWDDLRTLAKKYKDEIPKENGESSLFVKKIMKDQKVFARGTDLSGGGTSVKITNSNGNPGRVLLDFYNFGNIPENNTSAPLLARTESLKKLGIEKLDLQKTSFQNDLQKRFNLWKSKSPLFVKFLEQAMQNISIYYTTFQISKLDMNTYLPDQTFHESLDPRSVAFYAKGFGILISLREFEQFSYENQKALILHEILRHLQIGYGFKMEDETVQFLVNAILTADTTDSSTLDTAEYFGVQKWKALTETNDPVKVQIIFNEAAQLIAKYTGKHLAADLRSAKDSSDFFSMGSNLKNSLAEISLADSYGCQNGHGKNCLTSSDHNQVDLLIAQLRVVILTGIVQEFNTIEDDIKDRTLLLNNARQLDLQIDCANNKECASESSRSRLSGPFVELLKSGDITQ